MRYYLDASVALHAILGDGDTRARDWLDQARATGAEFYSSSLLELEIVRTLRRERIDPGFCRPLIERVNLVSIDDGIIRVAAALEPHVKSLDAIHLATCTILGFGVTLVTHDAAMRAAAASLGLTCTDPIE